MKILYIFLLLITAVGLPQTNSVDLLTSDRLLINSFNSIQEAYNAIPVPLTQRYLIEIKQTYEGINELYPIIFKNKQGSSALTNITIKPASDVISIKLSAHLNSAVIIIDSCNYLYFDGRANETDEIVMQIENTDSSLYSHSVDIINSSSNITMRSIKFHNPYSSSYDHYTRNINIGESYSTGNKDIEFRNCIIDGGNAGICSWGISGFPNSNILVRDCTIKNFTFVGGWMAPGTKSMIIEKCVIYQEIPQYVQNPTGIAINGTGNSQLIISRNKIYDLLSSFPSGITTRGIYVYGGNNAVITIVNNFIAMSLQYAGTTNNIYGIYLLGPNSFNTNIWFNTIYLGGYHTGGSNGTVVSACIAKINTSEAGYYNQLDNICVNTRTGGVTGSLHVALQIQNISLPQSNLNYNTYFSSGGPGSRMCSWLLTNYNDIQLYKNAAAPNESSSNFHSVQFVSSQDLHLANSSIGDINLTGTPIPGPPYQGVPYDIDANTRDAVYPYRGADETDRALPVELTSFSAEVSSNNVNLRWFLTSELNNSGFYIERSVGAEWKTVHFVKGRGTAASSFEYSYTDEALPSGIYSYRLKQVDFSGIYKYYVLKENVEITNSEFTLAQNFPNPFNPRTIIKYSLDREAKISLKVFNILGNEIAVLFEGKRSAGKYEAEFSSEHLPSGVYMYVLKAGDHTETKKMIIVK